MIRSGDDRKIAGLKVSNPKDGDTISRVEPDHAAVRDCAVRSFVNFREKWKSKPIWTR